MQCREWCWGSPTEDSDLAAQRLHSYICHLEMQWRMLKCDTNKYQLGRCKDPFATPFCLLYHLSKILMILFAAPRQQPDADLLAVGHHEVLQDVAVRPDQLQHRVAADVPHHQRGQTAGRTHHVAKPEQTHTVFLVS